MSASLDVIVAGAGPAGRALAAACAEQGLSVAAVAPDHEAAWPNTYGVWADELEPMGLADTLALRWPVTVVRGEGATHRLARAYGLIDNARLQARLRERLAAAGGSELSAGVAGASAGRALLDDSRELTARLVVDATGHRPMLLRWPGDPVAYQTAFGLIATCSAPPGEPGAMTLMDVRHSFLGPVAEPTFLYAMDLGGGRWFVEETSLARRQPMPLPFLESRLRHRLGAMGVSLSDEGPAEHCLFPMGTPLPAPQPVVGYGAAAGMVHPATGYQVGVALSRAPAVAAGLAAALDAAGPGEAAALDAAGPGEAAERAWEVVWGPDRRRQRALHDLGLESLLGLNAKQFERFFSAFFSLPEGRWRAYLSEARSAGELRRTMLAVFARAGGLRTELASTAIRAWRPGRRAPRRYREGPRRRYGPGSRERSMGGPSTGQW